MKQYQKPQIEISEFRLSDDIVITDSDIFDPFMNMSDDEIFVGEEEGYIVN